MNRRRTYRPPTSQIPADSLRGNPCDSCDPRRCAPPLKGLRDPRAASVSYRASVPAGHGDCGVSPSYRASSPTGESLPLRITATHPVAPKPIMNYESCIVHCFTFSAKERDSETDLSYFGSRYYSSDLSIWLSVDPMSDKYPSLSPYVYCADNPVRLVDPNGEEVFIYGKAKRAFFREVKRGAKALGISVKMDRFGKLSAKYNGKGPISEHGQLFLNAIEDGNITVNIEAIKDEVGTFTDYMFGGAFGGNVLIPKQTDGDWSFQFATAKQTVIPSELNAMDEFYGLSGRSSLHEITEAYMGARIALSENVISSATGSNNPLFERAHNGAIPQSGPIYRHCYDSQDNPTDYCDSAKWIDWNVKSGDREKNLKTTTIY